MDQSILSQALLSEQTVILVSGMTCLVMPALMVVYKATRETYPGFGLWALAFVSNGVGSVLLGAQLFLPAWLSLWVGNILIVAFPALLSLGLNVFIERPTRWRSYGLSLLLYAVLQGAFVYNNTDVGLRSVVFSAFVFTYVALFGWSVYHHLPRVLGKRDYLALTVIAVTIAIPVLRFGNILLKSSYTNPVTFQNVDIIFIMMMVLASVAMVVATISMNQQRLEFDLRQLSDALEEKSEALETLNTQLKTASLTDFLTGLGNRRFFDEEYKAIWKRSVKEQTALTILLLDVDCFKLYNDSLGHLAGDDCLKRIGQVLLAYPGFSDSLVARIGGEEFVVVMEAPADEALAQAEQLVSMVQQLSIPHPTSLVGPSVTVSIGVASRNANDTSPSKVLSRADHALYHAKSSGRNRALAA
jgi:diguanylate cyclase (GGDEF)-like protein